MEEEWRIYLRENRPDLYEQAVSSVRHIFNWRHAAGYREALEAAAKVCTRNAAMRRAITQDAGDYIAIAMDGTAGEIRALLPRTDGGA
jgi:hypothetical protein